MTGWKRQSQTGHFAWLSLGKSMGTRSGLLHLGHATLTFGTFVSPEPPGGVGTGIEAPQRGQRILLPGAAAEAETLSTLAQPEHFKLVAAADMKGGSLPGR